MDAMVYIHQGCTPSSGVNGQHVHLSCSMLITSSPEPSRVFSLAPSLLRLLGMRKLNTCTWCILRTYSSLWESSEPRLSPIIGLSERCPYSSLPPRVVAIPSLTTPFFRTTPNLRYHNNHGLNQKTYLTTGERSPRVWLALRVRV